MLGKVVRRTFTFLNAFPAAEMRKHISTNRPPNGEPDEEGHIHELADNFQADGNRFKNLLLAIATSEGFRSLGEVE